MRMTLRTLAPVVACLAAFATLVPAARASAGRSACAVALANTADVGGPTGAVAWRAGLEMRTAVYGRLPGSTRKVSRWIGPTNAPSLLVVGRPRASGHRCWVDVRLPWRPNGAAGWINVNNVLLAPTHWRIVVSRARRTLTLWHAGKVVRTVRVVVGKPSTPTPTGLFAIVWAVPWHPDGFLGSWVLTLTGHSDVLQQFDGGDGTVGIHGRGGTSLLDPLGSARSHGCIRLANDAIDWLVKTVGRGRLAGTPVQIS
jgi:lipoprotein-anchoring transpeptidase ErfK/SrfK